MLIESKGRIFTTGSISGFVVWGFGGPYTMSKHAVEAYTDALAAEMAPFGVEVGVVEPGNYKSQIMANRRERMIEAAQTLGQDTDFVRVDLYLIGQEIYFGELTHSPAAGQVPFEDAQLEKELGSYWHLPQRYR